MMGFTINQIFLNKLSLRVNIINNNAEILYIHYYRSLLDDGPAGKPGRHNFGANVIADILLTISFMIC